MQKRELFFGCVADDFTGASDGASFLVKSGLSTALFNGIPGGELKDTTIQAAVIALKSRTQERKAAVKDSLAAFRWLAEQGAKILYFKYCSTFDSSDAGNIGPVIDAVLEEFGFSHTVLCPSLPVNGRKVSAGKLYVNGVLLENSHMKNHPLTPMHRSRLADLMSVQGKYPCIETAMPMSDGESRKIRDAEAKGEHFYIVPDYETDEQGAQIAETFSELGFYTGGSGLLEHLGRLFGQRYGFLAKEEKRKAVDGQTVLLAGSCSEATLGQIADYQKGGHHTYRIDPELLLSGKINAEDIWDMAGAETNRDFLIYSSARADEVKQIQEKAGRAGLQISQVLEKTMADLAQIAREKGVKKIVVAGGETSGAVIQKLGFQGYRIWDSIAPGVPVMSPLEQPDLRLVLKSGNFGQEDFFSRSVQMLQEKEM